jgi:hypothetical protein
VLDYLSYVTIRLGENRPPPPREQGSRFSGVLFQTDQDKKKYVHEVDRKVEKKIMVSKHRAGCHQEPLSAEKKNINVTQPSGSSQERRNSGKTKKKSSTLRRKRAEAHEIFQM